MDCPVCAEAIDGEDQFCKHCGARLGATAELPRSATVSDMVAEYRQRLADEPDDPSALYNLGLGCLYSGRYDTAAEAFEAVTRLLPEDAVAYEKLAVALVRLGRRDEALDRAREAHRLDPDRASISRLVRVLEG